jgi:hypothetical protein
MCCSCNQSPPFVSEAECHVCDRHCPGNPRSWWLMGQVWQSVFGEGTWRSSPQHLLVLEGRWVSARKASTCTSVGEALSLL